jgi:hypothetical protein
MEPRITHHSQPNSIAWPEQAPGEHGQSKLQMSMARASSRRAQSKLQEGAEKNRGGEALTRRLGGTTVAWRGSARAATMAPSLGKSPTTCQRIT